jgi:ABC-type uncharacterized transport system substrate-binding protein
LGFAAKNRLAAMYPTNEFVEGGGLMSYAPNPADLWRHAADFVDKILKGTKPGDIPVEQPTKVRVHRQSASSEADRPDHSAVVAVPGGQGDQMIKRRR